MLIEIGVVLASILPATIIGAMIGHRLTDRSIITASIQAKVGMTIGLLAVEFIGLALWVAVATTIASQTINALATLVKLWNRRQRRKALNGDYGEMTQWAAEITKEGDREFAIAIQALPDSEKMELGIIAEIKEELRELTIERFDELADDSIPEDFAQ